MTQPRILISLSRSPFSELLVRRLQEDGALLYCMPHDTAWNEMLLLWDGSLSIFGVISDGSTSYDTLPSAERVISIHSHLDWDESGNHPTSDNRKDLYFGEILGSDDGIANRILSESANGTVRLPYADSPLFVISISDAVSTVLREMFSYWYPKRAVVSERTSIWNFSKIVQSKRPSLKLQVGEGVTSSFAPKISLLQMPSEGYEASLQNLLPSGHQESALAMPATAFIPHPHTFNIPKITEPKPNVNVTTKPQVLESAPANTAEKSITLTIPEISFPRITLPRFSWPAKALSYAQLLLVFMIFSPLALFVSSAVLLGAAVPISQVHIDTSKALFRSSVLFADASHRWISLYSSFPVVGSASEIASKHVLLVKESSTLMHDGIVLAHTANELFTEVMGEDPYDVSERSVLISSQSDKVYQDINRVSLLVDSLPYSLPETITEGLEIGKELALAAREFGAELPDVLGVSDPKTYMVLLQNNMELRPTGGFIGSFALLTFHEGRLIDKPVYDVYFADGQMKGYVRPPEPIEAYLGEASWYLRDANWDPDFPTSARRISWFLDKTLDRDIDGVIGVNLEVAESILSAIGPITLHDYGDQLTADNVYEVLQYQTDKDFVPGSKKKASYLSGFAQSLLLNIEDRGRDNLFALGSAVMEKIKSRDIQIALDNPRAMNASRVLGWSGEVSAPDCAGNCDVIQSGLVEANVGVNKANYFVDRKANLRIERVGDEYRNTLTLYIKNSGDVDRVPETRYKSYIRIITSKEARVLPIVIRNSQGTSKVEPEIETLVNRMESGVLVDTLPQDTSSVVFEWTEPAHTVLEAPGKLVYHYWKQSGVPEYPITIEIEGVKGESLTQRPPYIYNTHTRSDIIGEVSWN